MASAKWLLAGTVSVAVGALVASSCGPRPLSALGNPGDFCTEHTSCTDGSECRPTDDGYRCVGGPNDPSPLRVTPSETSEDSAPITYSVESGGEDAGDGSTMEFEEASTSEGSAKGEDEYLPPSRRRRDDR